MGGQFAGRRAARMLSEGEFEVTLVDAKGFWEYTPGALRCLVEPAAARRLVQPQPAGTLTAAAVSLEVVEDGSVKSVELSDGSRVPADFVVLATGSTYVAPIKADHVKPSCAEQRREEITAAHRVLESAPSVLIVGGGTVGVELAAEIVGVWGRTKAVTLVASQGRLLERMPPRAGKLAANWLRKKGVNVILNDRIEDWGGCPESAEPEPPPSGGKWTLRTKLGQELHAALVYRCVGGRPCAGPVSPTSAPSALGPRGEVHVTRSLQVEGLRNVFAVGDCAGTTEEKTAFSADLNATAVALNIRALHRGKPARNYPEVVRGTDRVPAIVCVSLY